MNGKADQIAEGLWKVGGDGLTNPMDCHSYLVDLGDLVLVDCGLGPDWDALRENIASTGRSPTQIRTLLLTHGHIDHVGAAASVRRDSGCRVVMHQADAWILEQGDMRASAAHWYGTTLRPCAVDEKISAPRSSLSFSRGTLDLIHCPGHTPGSLCALLSAHGEKILFGQDVHGPFHPDFDSDLAAWHQSMSDLLALGPDILCEGHLGVIRPAEAVASFIHTQLDEHPVP